MRLLSEQVAFALFRRERAGEMLQASEVIDADILRDSGVLLSIRAGMKQSSGSAPIFVGCVGEEDFGYDFVRRGAVEQSAFLCRQRIDLRFISKGKDVGGEEDRRSGLRVPRRLRETVIEAAAARPRNVGKHAIERHSSVFVGVEALIKKVAQEASVLRNALAVDPRCRSDGIGCVLGIGRKIAYDGEAGPGYDRVSDNINVFVYFAGLKTTVQVDISVAQGELAIHGMSELPLRARNEGTLAVSGVPDRQHIEGIVRCGDRVFKPADITENKVSQRNLRHHPRGHQIATQQTGDGLSIFFRDRRRETQCVGTVSIPLPTEAHDGEAVTQQPSISRVALKIEVPTIRKSNNACATAVGHLQKQRAIAPLCVLRADGNEVGRDLDLAVHQGHSVAEIDDPQVVWIGQRKRKVDAPDDALIGPCVAQRPTVPNICAGRDLDTSDPGIERRNQEGENQE